MEEEFFSTAEEVADITHRNKSRDFLSTIASVQNL